jgi:hypothetical protein
LHCSASEGRNILRKILENIPNTSIHDDGPEDVVEKTLEEESVIVEPEPLTTPLKASTILQVPEPPKEEEIPPLENILEFKDELFSDFGNTTNYFAIRKSSAKLALGQHLPDPTKEKFLKKNVKELTMIISNEWLGESKLSSKVNRLDSPSTSIRCQIHKTSFDAFYNLVVGVNIMSKSFAHTLPRNFQLTSTTKFLKSLSRQILPSEGIFHLIPIKVDETKVYLSLYVFDIWEFDLLIGHPIEKLLH